MKIKTGALNIESSHFLAGWSPDVGTLFVPALSQSHVGDRVVVRIGLQGQPVYASICGEVSMARPVGSPSLPPGVKIQVDPASLPAVRYLAAVASGAPANFRVRSPRFLRERPVVVSVGGKRVRTHTLSVSEAGCAIAWPEAEFPESGEVASLRFGPWLLSPSIAAAVNWRSQEDATLGLSVIVKGRGGRAWREVVQEASRTLAGDV